MDAREFTLRVLPGTWLVTGGTCIFVGALAGLGMMGASWSFPNLPSMMVLWAAGIAIILKLHKKLHARIDGADLIVRTGARNRVFPLSELDYVLEDDFGVDNSNNLYLVLKNGKLKELLDDDPVTEFGARVAQLAEISFMIDRYGSSASPQLHPERLDS